jgi:hypothetical protein
MDTAAQHRVLFQVACESGGKEEVWVGLVYVWVGLDWIRCERQGTELPHRFLDALLEPLLCGAHLWGGREPWRLWNARRWHRKWAVEITTRPVDNCHVGIWRRWL